MKSTIVETSPLLPKNTSQEELDYSSPTKWQLVIQFIRGITVEPAYFLFTLAYGIDGTMLVNLWVDKECGILYSEEVCKELDSGKYPAEQDNIQKIVNDYKSAYSQWIEYLPAVFVVILLGAWSDAKDRRFPIVLPFVGCLFKSIGLVINSYWWFIPPQYILLASIPVGLGGGMMALVLGCSSYLSTVSSVRTRTVRLSIIMIIMLFGLPLGKTAATILYSRYGYAVVFGTEAVLNACGILYAALRLEKHPGSDALRSQVEQTSFRDLLSLTRMKKTLSVVWKEREGNARTHIIGHILIIAGLLFDMGTTNFIFLYTRKKFGWDIYTYTTYAVIYAPCAALGNIVVMPVLSYCYQVDDSIMGLMGTWSFMFSNIIVATAPTGWAMYTAVGAGVLSGLSFSASRGALSKLVPPEELGGVFALVALGETIIPLFNGPIYTAVYNATLDVYPGTIFAMAATVFAVLSCMYTWLLTRPDKLQRK